MNWITDYRNITKTIRLLVVSMTLFFGELVCGVFIYGPRADVNADIRLDGRGLNIDSLVFWKLYKGDQNLRCRINPSSIWA